MPSIVYAECRKLAFLLSVFMMNVFVLSVVMLNVVALTMDVKLEIFGKNDKNYRRLILKVLS
jgi:hypothetical protein